MTSRISLAFFTLLLAFVGASIHPHPNTSKCAMKQPITDADFLLLAQRSPHLPESILCLLKCEYEENGIMNPDKTMNIGKVLAKMSEKEPLGRALEDEFTACIQKIAHPVNTCSQLQPYINCVATMEKKQKLQRRNT